MMAKGPLVVFLGTDRGGGGPLGGDYCLGKNSFRAGDPSSCSRWICDCWNA